jgi:hypothetical protein
MNILGLLDSPTSGRYLFDGRAGIWQESPDRMLFVEIESVLADSPHHDRS